MENSQDTFLKLCEEPNEEIENMIKRDLDRTIMITENLKLKKSLKEKKTKLYNVLKAYSVYDKEVSYVQGTNYIVNLLLCNLNSQRAAFWTFVQLMYEKNWRDLFVNNTPKLQRMLMVLQEIIKIKIPDLYKHFETTEVLFL